MWTKTTAALLLAAAVLAGCGDKPDAAACEAAIRAQVADAMAGQEQSKPKQCEGLSDAELEEIGARVLEGLGS